MKNYNFFLFIKIQICKISGKKYIYNTLFIHKKNTNYEVQLNLVTWQRGREGTF